MQVSLSVGQRQFGPVYPGMHRQVPQEHKPRMGPPHSCPCNLYLKHFFIIINKKVRNYELKFAQKKKQI